MDTISPDSDTQVQNEGAGQERVSLPRWVIYFQGALLGIVATTFFIFGMMVGSLTDSSVAKRIQSCRVSGIVFDASGDENRPDRGSVVVLLPVGSEFEEREDPTSIHPSRFQPLNNALIDKIHRMGGAVVRTDDSGRFEVFVESPQRISSWSSPRTRQEGKS